MKMIFEVFINALEMFIVISFLTKYFQCKYTGLRAVLSFCIAWLASFATVTTINHFTIFESFATYIYILVYFAYALICLKGKVLLKLWVSIIAQIIITLIAIITIIATSVIVDCDPQLVITDFSLTRVISVSFTKLLLILVYLVILKCGHKYDTDSSLWYKLIIIPLITVISSTKLMEVCFLFPQSRRVILLGILSLVMANIMVYYFYTVLGREYQNKLKIKLLEQQNENINQYVSDANAFVNEMRIVRHDIRNHLLSIHSYLDDNRIQEAKKYIGGLTEEYMPSTHKYISTGNIAFDAIVNSKMAICRQENVHFDIFVGDDSIKMLNQIDTGIIFGNLLDNAVEAAIKSEKRYIQLDLQIKHNYLNIFIKNSIDRSVLSNNELLITSKDNKDLHGLGIQSVKNVVKKYDGMISFFEEKNMFCCQISLHINNL